jgi:hypothetical protein
MDSSIFEESSSEQSMNSAFDRDGQPYSVEQFPKEFAKAILGNKYLNKCSYQLMSSSTETILIQVDETYPPDDKRRFIEYPLNSDNEVKTYEQMKEDIMLAAETVSTTVEEQERPKTHWILLFSVLMVTLLAIGVITFKYLLSLM